MRSRKMSYSIDIYRTDDAILIHDKPGGLRRAWPGLLLGLVGGAFFGFVAVGLFLDPEPMPLGAIICFSIFGWVPIFSVVFILFFAFLAGGHETFLIDRDSIRRDWWCSLGCRSRIYPRPETIRMDTGPGFFLLGGPFGVVIRTGKRRRQAWNMYLPSAAERHWLFAELARFQEEVPADQTAGENRPVRKGSFREQESGVNVLQTLDWRGRLFQRIVPPSEWVSDGQAEQVEPGLLVLRCAKCHQIVPRNHVLPNKPLAKCPDCGFLFEPQELRRGEPPKKRRLQVHRGTDSLEIVQKPLQTGVPLWTILLLVLFGLGMGGLYFYVKQMFPDESPFSFLPTEDFRMPIAFIVVYFLFLPPLLWAFFDRRTIRLTRETLEISGRWLFFVWRKTVSRHHVHVAKGTPLWDVLELSSLNLRLLHEKGSVWIGCTMPKEFETLRGEINYFLYTVEPARLAQENSPSQSVFLSGAESLDPEIGLHCPDCRSMLPGKSLDFPNNTAHCDSCETAFPMTNAVSYRIDVVASWQPENITVGQTDDRLTMRYVPNHKKWAVFRYETTFSLIVLTFAGMSALAIGLALMEGTHGLFLMLVTVVLVPMVAFIYFMLADEKNEMYCSWAIHLDANEARLELRCKKRQMTVVIAREKIVEARSNEEETKVAEVIRFGYFPSFLWSRRDYGGHFLLKDGTKHYLPLGTVDHRKTREVRNWMLATLNGFLTSHPVYRGARQGSHDTGTHCESPGPARRGYPCEA